MSVSSILSSIDRVQREIESLQRQGTDEARKVASKTERIAQINSSITASTSPSTRQSKTRDIQSTERDIVAIQKRQADITKRVADRTAELHKYQQQLYKEQDRERKSLMDSIQKRDREVRAEQAAMLGSLRLPSMATAASPVTAMTPLLQHDAFISHATEDKDDLVRPLAERLRALGFDIWYDEFQLTVGDSLRRSIDKGLARSRFGIVVLSSAFFAKNWPQYELDGLVAKEMTGGKVILPLWHRVSKDEVIAFSPSLADKVALNTTNYSIDELAEQLGSVLRR